VARFDSTTGKLIQNSGLIVGDAGTTHAMTFDLTSGTDPVLTGGDGLLSSNVPIPTCPHVKDLSVAVIAGFSMSSK
jgi:hypothetical protein